jgi:hypothetical protein
MRYNIIIAVAFVPLPEIDDGLLEAFATRDAVGEMIQAQVELDGFSQGHFAGCGENYFGG